MKKRILASSFVLFIISLPLDNILVTTPFASFGLTKIAGYIFFLACIINFSKIIKNVNVPTYLFLIYLVYLIAQMIVINIDNYNFVINRIITFMQLLLLFFVLSNIFSDEQFRNLFVLFYTLAIVLVAIISINFNVDLIGETKFGPHDRLSYFGQDGNSSGGQIGVSIVLMLSYLKKNQIKNWKSILSIISICILSYTLAKTGSRGAVLALISSLTIGIIAYPRAYINRPFIISIILFVAVIWITYATDPYLYNRWVLTVYEAHDGHRLALLSIGWDLFMERPLFGFGMYENMLEIAKMMGLSGVFGAHSMPLNILTEVGLVGGLPYFGALLCCLCLCIKRIRQTEETALLSIFFYLLFVNLSINWEFRKMHWILLAYVCARPIKYRQK